MSQARSDTSGHAAELHRQAIVWDTHGGFSPFADLDLSFLERWRTAGATFLSVNVGYDHVITWQDTIRAIAHFRRWLLLRPESFVLAETTIDIERAKRERKLAVAFDLEGTDALDGNLEMIALYHRLGVRQMLFAYNRSNTYAGGCHDEDVPLTPLGREALAELNRVGIVVDCSHTSYRSTMEIMERSTAPVVFSHSNPRALCDHGRNIRDDQIKACARSGGVIGINGVGAFLGDNDISAARMVRHIDHVAQLVGGAHVGLGLDYLPDIEEVPKLFARYPHAWPGYSTTDMMDTRFAPPELLPEITKLLLAKGYADDDVRGILGENFLRVARQVWK